MQSVDTFWSNKTDVLLEVKHPPYITTLTDNLRCLVPHQSFNSGKSSSVLSCHSPKKCVAVIKYSASDKLYFSVLFEWYSHLQTDNLNELLDIDLSWQVSLSLNQSKQELEDSIQHVSMELSSRNDCALESSQNSFSLLDNTDTGLCELLMFCSGS